MVELLTLPTEPDVANLELQERIKNLAYSLVYSGMGSHQLLEYPLQSVLRYGVWEVLPELDSYSVPMGNRYADTKDIEELMQRTFPSAKPDAGAHTYLSLPPDLTKKLWMISHNPTVNTQEFFAMFYGRESGRRLVPVILYGLATDPEFTNDLKEVLSDNKGKGVRNLLMELVHAIYPGMEEFLMGSILPQQTPTIHEIESIEVIDIKKDLRSTGITLRKLGTGGSSQDELLQPPSMTDINNYIAAASQELNNAVALEASQRSEVQTKALKRIVFYGTASFRNIATLWSSLQECVERQDTVSIHKALQALLKDTLRIDADNREGSHGSYFPHINIYRDLYNKVSPWIGQKIKTQVETKSMLLVDSLTRYLGLPLKTPQLQSQMANVISGMEHEDLVRLVTYLLAIEATRYQPDSENPFSGLHNLSQCLGVDDTRDETNNLVSSMIASYNHARELKIEGQISFESGNRYSKLRKAIHQVWDMKHRVEAARAKLTQMQKG